MKYSIVLVALNQEQIAKAKEVNGKRKRITHALICGPYGQIFGTERQCTRYYDAWSVQGIFPNILTEGVKTDKYEVSSFESTFNLVNKLIAFNDAAVGNQRTAKSLAEYLDDKDFEIVSSLASSHKSSKVPVKENRVNSGCGAVASGLLTLPFIIVVNLAILLLFH